MTIADDLVHPNAPSTRGEASGLLVIDQDLLICQISQASADILGIDEDGLMGRAITDFIGLSPEMQSLQAELLGHGEAGWKPWQADIDGRRVQVHGFVDGFSALPQERLIMLTISEVMREVSRQETVLPPTFADPDSRSVRSHIFPGFLILLAVVGLGLAISDSESRSVDDDAALGETAVHAPSPGPSGDEPSGSTAEDMSIRRFAGQLLPAVSVAGVAPLDGMISSISAPSFGVAVEKGDLLITLDPGEGGDKALREARITLIEAKSELLKLKNWSTSAEMREAERSLNEAEHMLKRTMIERDRTKMLFDEGIIAANEYETAVESVRSAELSKASAEARHDEVAAQAKGEFLDIATERFGIAEADYTSLETAQQDRKVRAPIDGILLPAPGEDNQSNELSIGLTIEKGTSLFVIGSVDDLIVQTSVSEFDVDMIKVGQQAQITSPARPDVRLVGEVVSISQISSSFSAGNTETNGSVIPPARYDVTVKVSTKDQEMREDLRIGMTVDVEIDTAQALVAVR